MSYSFYTDNYRNNYKNNINQIEKKNPSSSPHLSSKLNSTGKIASIPMNYHYLQKQKDKEREMRNKNSNIENPRSKSTIPNSLINNYRPNSITNISTYRNENNKNNNNDIFNNNSYYQNNYLRKNFDNNKYINKNKQDKKEIKIQQNLYSNQIESEKTQRAKELMDDFDKKLYDTISNFHPNNTKIGKKFNEVEDKKRIQNNNNLKQNFRKSNLSYERFNTNKSNNNKFNNNNYIHNYHQISTLHNTNNLYKNYFGNNINNPNENWNGIYNKDNDYINNNYINNSYNSDNYRNKRNSIDKIFPNKCPLQNFSNNIKNIEKFENINKSEINFSLKKYSSYSLGGTDSFKHPKINQDSYLTKEDSKNYIFGIFDGHGFEGHLVSQAIKNYLNNNINSITFSSKENILNIFKNLSLSINSSTTFNSMESGSTVVLTFISDNKIICANCGDSRAALISENENKVIPLSRDHKPDLPEEKRRILECGGRVDKIFGMGPFRVWFKDTEYPGLAMSRSIGDGYAHKVGVIDIPEILEFEVEKIRPKAIILGSDGVFEFVKNEEIKEIVEKYYYNKNSQGCSKEIVEHSRKIWENSGYAIDDITCIVGFF